MTIHSRPSSRFNIVAIFAVAALVLFVAGVPHILSSQVRDAVSSEDAAVPPPVLGGGSGFQAWLSSRNARLGETLEIRVHAPQMTQVWLFASTLSGPSSIGIWPVDLGSDWMVLSGPVPVGATCSCDFTMWIPGNPALAGAEATFQAGVWDYANNDVTWSNSVDHRIPDLANTASKSVLVVRQVSMPTNSVHQPLSVDGLVTGLSASGHTVHVADDWIPQDLASYDVLFDCRGQLGLATSERIALSRFMQRYGGVFILGAGPYGVDPNTDNRISSISDWMVTDLGIVASAIPGAAPATIHDEWISPQASTEFLAQQSSLAGLSYQVDQAGAHFARQTMMTAGMPMVTSAEPDGWVYGAEFSEVEVQNFRARGHLCVLFNGSADALSGESATHHAESLITALVSFLNE